MTPANVTVYVIEADMQIIETDGYELTQAKGWYWVPALGYSTADVFFGKFDVMNEQAKRVEIARETLLRVVFNEDGSPKGVAQRIHRVDTRHNRILPTDELLRHATEDQ